MRRVPSIPSSVLRDHAAPERLDRIWRRIQPDLSGSGRIVPRPGAGFWIPAALAAMFASGVFVGAKWVRPEHAATLTAERPSAPEPATGPAAAAPERAAEPTAARPLPQARKSRALEGLGESELTLSVPEAPPAAALLAPAGPPEWERLADDDRFEEARAALEARGGFDAMLGSASASQLMTLADIARFSGSRDHAILALRRVVEAFPEAQVAPDAALTLANQLEQSGDGAGAAEALALYRRLSPSGDFAEDALARQVDSAIAQGSLEDLARLVAQYENDFPNGPRLEEFRAELAKRGAGVSTSEPSASPAGAPRDNVPADGEKSPSK